ncbi:leucyl/phenylalanyl-tRNA--protein transferase [Desulfonema magnum]|uniref:Leucyl/phenylalanyl-tRNA--protein transferase n=1 Tax=Desulfonema magnum TaxID=45655 RepID=A0A975BJD7_9BACT|nr:leucyl/phenylalanyl-tRNA--protein transferase [Desulfonema magnum]QTA86403.1 Leucyl/phenylalanyl-tRNA--protein transferase [Desulfonema magnum]
MTVFLLSDKIGFPPPHLAEKDGLLAIGGDLSEKRLILAYRMGIFPWYSDDEPLIWWSPDPRLVLYPREIRVSKRLKRTIRKGDFHVTMDLAFPEVITACAELRKQKGEGTWIVDGMIEAYCKLHESGFAHSVEAWYGGELAGGLYGVSLGKCFFGESMFARVSNASKVAFVRLVKYLEALSFDMIDCQVTTDHLLRFGAREIPRKRFLRELEKSLRTPTIKGKWHFYV